MPQTYLYKARNNTGQVVTGQMEAEDERAVVMQLREQGSIIISIAQQEIKQNLLDKIQFSKKVALKDLAVFCRQFATMLNAGLPIINSLGVMIEQSENKSLAKILAEINAEIESGSTLTQAFGKYPAIFPNLFISLVQVGETTGTIDNVLNRLAVYYEKEYELKEKIKSAMTYPTVVMVMACLVVIFLVTFILPIFEGVFQDMDIELPFITQFLLDSSHFLRTYWYLVLVLVGTVVYGLKIYFGTENGRLNFDKYKIKMPVLGSMTLKMSVSRFSLSLAIMTSSGVPALQAIMVARDTLDNQILAKEIDSMQEFVRNGGNISGFLENSNNFPSMMSKMIAVGETTGSLDSMLDKIAEFYEKEVQFVVDRLTSLIEPVLIIFLGLTVGTIVLAIMLPMMNLIGNMGG